MSQETNSVHARKAWIGLLSKAPAAELARLWEALNILPEHSLLRTPEIGSVMVRGSLGASGDGFNLGEVTVTRCSVRLDTGEDGHAYVQGRDKQKALQAALIDALMQTDSAVRIQAQILDPLATYLRASKAKRAAKAAATKVDFFTLVRGED